MFGGMATLTLNMRFAPIGSRTADVVSSVKRRLISCRLRYSDSTS